MTLGGDPRDASRVSYLISPHLTSPQLNAEHLGGEHSSRVQDVSRDAVPEHGHGQIPVDQYLCNTSYGVHRSGLVVRPWHMHIRSAACPRIAIADS